MKEHVLLLHGFNKSARDMQPLAGYLEECGFLCTVLDLPLTRKEFDLSACLVEDSLRELLCAQHAKVHLVGHSTGGLLIRKVLQETEYLSRIGRCVQIAAPNRGSQLADTACKLGVYSAYYRTLQSLQTSYIEQICLPDSSLAEIGAIAGTRNHLLLGKLISGENDGRIESSSVHYPGLADFIKLPYGHKEIHRQSEVAELTARFLQQGYFK